MMYERKYEFIHGDGLRISEADAGLMRRLADPRGLDARTLAQASAGARELLQSWCNAGWLHGL